MPPSGASRATVGHSVALNHLPQEWGCDSLSRTLGLLHIVFHSSKMCNHKSKRGGPIHQLHFFDVCG